MVTAGANANGNDGDDDAADNGVYCATRVARTIGRAAGMGCAMRSGWGVAYTMGRGITIGVFGGGTIGGIVAMGGMIRISGMLGTENSSVAAFAGWERPDIAAIAAVSDATITAALTRIFTLAPHRSVSLVDGRRRFFVCRSWKLV